LSRDEAENQLKSASPQHRFIEPEEVAASVAWLCLPGSESITGQSIPITGGATQA
ncbi:MAG: 3-hydroxybutyrate dehydrogenase, partial [Planctomycetota bacterium]